MTIRRRRRDWEAILRQAADIVNGYDTGVTLRQLFYRLVAAEILPNTQSAYKTLSEKTAEGRRRGTFPDLIDRTRDIHEDLTFTDPAEAQAWLAHIYRRDRTEFQDVSLYIGVEKDGLVTQLRAWFGELGIPVLALGGYSSQAYVDRVARHATSQGRPAVLLYAGDFDPSGVDIDRDFIERTACFEEVVRVALTPKQVERYDLPPQMGKATDSRAAAFVAKHGRLVQVEVDALMPETLRELFSQAIARYWDTSAYEAALRLEREDRAKLVG